MCVHGKQEYVDEIKKVETGPAELEELQKREAELEQEKKESEEQLSLADETKRQEEEAKKDVLIAAQCTCSWECGDNRNDGTVCFKKCCGGMFGGTIPVKKPKPGEDGWVRPPEFPHPEVRKPTGPSDAAVAVSVLFPFLDVFDDLQKNPQNPFRTQSSMASFQKLR